MAFKICILDEFFDDLGRAPLKVQKAIKRVIADLESSATEADGQKIKKLKGYKGYWRYRLADTYRLIYRVEKREVTLVMLGHRDGVYDRMGLDNGKPGVRVIATIPDVLDPTPSSVEVGRAVIAMPAEEASGPEEPLPARLSPELLDQWGVPEKFWLRLGAVTTAGDLLGLSDTIPSVILERILTGLYPVSLAETHNQPVRIVEDVEHLVEAAEGKRTLADFLLRLDNLQNAFVGRFDIDDPEGPWLLKGGPGSGKSIVALYCIRELLVRDQSRLPGQRQKPSILLTTYTNALTRASRDLLNRLVADHEGNGLEVSTLDRMAMRNLDDSWSGISGVDNPIGPARRALDVVRGQSAGFSFQALDVDFLVDEIDWVIAGLGIEKKADYLEADRGGRGRGLTEKQRSDVWSFWLELRKTLRSTGHCLWSERHAVAAKRAEASYDYVFVDEAQDLKPALLRLAVSLCRGGRNVFVTADTNQSIYGSGMRWGSIAEQLRFTGRTSVLKQNYRTTNQTWAGVKQLAPTSDQSDKETLDVRPVYDGPEPRLAWYADWERAAERLNSFLFDALRSERVGADSAAVLCPTGPVMDEVMAALDPRFNAKKMSSRNLDITHPGTKVTTIHASKGLQFPVVAIVGVEEGRLPRTAPPEVDYDDWLARQHRLFFVGCTRAAARLLVLASSARPSPFMSGATDEFWEIEYLD